MHFRKAISSEAKPLVGLYAESGCGKTKSALLLARGFTGDMSKVAMIETESGRGEAYADDPDVGGYNVLSLRDEFSPKTYGAAIAAAEREGVQALIIDSASHEWEGVGGVLAMAAANQEAGKKGPIVWQQPKLLHAREFMLRLTQTPIPLVIVCMRAKYPMKEVPKAGGGKDWIRSTELEPKQSDDILFEMFVHGWIDREHRLHVTKYTLDGAMRKVFIDGEPVTIGTGERLAAWAKRRPIVDPLDGLKEAAARGSAALRSAWSKLSTTDKARLKPDGNDGPEMVALKKQAAAVDAQPKEAAPDVSEETVISDMSRASNRDALDAACSLADALPDADARERVRQAYHQQLERFA